GSLVEVEVDEFADRQAVERLPVGVEVLPGFLGGDRGEHHSAAVDRLREGAQDDAVALLVLVSADDEERPCVGLVGAGHAASPSRAARSAANSCTCRHTASTLVGCSST